MPRFLIIAGILVAAAIIFDPSADVEVVEYETVPATAYDEQAVVSSEFAALQKSALEAIPAAVQIAPAAVAETQIEPEEAVVAPQPPVALAPENTAVEPDISAFVLLSPHEMTTAVQTELKRLACYTGKIDGIWGRGSRAAIGVFNERSNNSFHTNESVELLTALKKAPDGLCDSACADGSCQIIASAEATASPLQEKTQPARDGAPSYLPPWMRGEQVAEAAKEESELSESYSGTHTSVSQRVYERPRRAARRPIYRAARRKKNWLPEGWPGVD